MAILNTTDIVDSSIMLKARLKHNMVGDNYYIQNLQYKRDQDWEYRYNTVDIEEEKDRQIEYTTKMPEYTPLETVVIRSVKGERGEDLGTDWAEISFRDLKYPNPLGKRYRFSLEFQDLSTMTEEEKHYDTSVWIAVNNSPINPRNSCVIRRCNANIALLGSPTNSQTDATEIRYEPIVLENELKYMNQYYNKTLVIPQAEWYVTMQLNYFSNAVKINSRVILGGTDQNDIENNAIYKVKAVIKSTSIKTFAKSGFTGLEDIPFVVLALDKDLWSANDDAVTRVANNAPLYLIPKKEDLHNGEYHITLKNCDDYKIILGNSLECETELSFKGGTLPTHFEYKVVLNGIKEENWSKYYEFEQTGDNTFKIKNLKACNRGTLDVIATCADPDIAGVTISETFSFKLGGFY